MTEREQERGRTTRWVHFTTDWEADSALKPSEYRCKRCSEVVETTDECYDHRSGILSECSVRRLRKWVRDHVGRGVNNE